MRIVKMHLLSLDKRLNDDKLLLQLSLHNKAWHYHFLIRKCGFYEYVPTDPFFLYVYLSSSTVLFMIIIGITLFFITDYPMKISRLNKHLNRFQHVLQMIDLINVLCYILFKHGLILVNNITFDIGLHMEHLLVMFIVVVCYHMILILIYSS